VWRGWNLVTKEEHVHRQETRFGRKAFVSSPLAGVLQNGTIYVTVKIEINLGRLVGVVGVNFHGRDRYSNGKTIYRVGRDAVMLAGDGCHVL
jgi:hypothetical protein